MHLLKIAWKKSLLRVLMLEWSKLAMKQLEVEYVVSREMADMIYSKRVQEQFVKWTQTY